VFRSDAGRQVLGGGGVTPDVIVKPDTSTIAERELLRSVGPASQTWHVTLNNYALEQKNSIKPNFTITPEMREEFFQRLTKAKVPVTKAQFDGAPDLVIRNMEEYFARLAFGDSAVFRRREKDDSQVAAALDYLRRGRTQRQILALASSDAARSRQQQEE
jgi:carboxyl-terminal processing protease